MQTKTIRILSIILVALTVVPMLFACNNSASTGNTQDTNDNSGVDTGEQEDIFEVPDVTFDGAEFTILTAGNVAYNDFDMGDLVDSESKLVQAQHKRVQTVENKYDIDIVLVIDENKKSFGNGPGYTNINTAVQSQEATYNLGIIGGYDVATCAESNLLYDLNSIEYVSTQKAWWDQNANEDLTINGMLFFTNGSLTAAYSESTFVIYMNSEIAQQKIGGVEGVYQLVRDGKWTVDKLSEFTKTVSEDFDGDGQMGKDDVYGLYVWDDSILGMLAAAGVKCATVEDDGNIALTFYNETSLNMFNKYTEIAYNSAYAFTYQRQISGANVWNRFKEGKALFWATSNVNTKNIRDMNSDFGILPYPKLSEDQTRYYSTIAPYNSQFICIPSYQTDTEMVGAITEALAYHGYKTVWPACYEDTLQGMWARDEGTYDMLDIIYGSYIYDIGYYYMIGDYHSGPMNLVRSKLSSFISMYETNATVAQSKLDIINANYAEVLSSWEEIRQEIKK